MHTWNALIFIRLCLIRFGKSMCDKCRIYTSMYSSTHILPVSIHTHWPMWAFLSHTPRCWLRFHWKLQSKSWSWVKVSFVPITPQHLLNQHLIQSQIKTSSVGKALSQKPSWAQTHELLSLLRGDSFIIVPGPRVVGGWGVRGHWLMACELFRSSLGLSDISPDMLNKCCVSKVCQGSVTVCVSGCIFV